MQSLDENELKLVLGEVLKDNLKVIYEYVKEIPGLSSKIDRLDAKFAKMNGRQNVLEHVVIAHESDIKTIEAKLKLKTA